MDETRVKTNKTSCEVLIKFIVQTNKDCYYWRKPPPQKKDLKKKTSRKT